MKISRRSFLAYSGGTALTLYVVQRLRHPDGDGRADTGRHSESGRGSEISFAADHTARHADVGAERLRRSGTAIHAADPAGAVARDDRMELRLDD